MQKNKARELTAADMIEGMLVWYAWSSEASSAPFWILLVAVAAASAILFRLGKARWVVEREA